MKTTKYQLIKFTVNQAREKVRILFDTNNLYEQIDSMFLSLPFEKSYFGSRLELQVNGEEIFPPYFEAKLLATNLSVAPSERFFSLKDEHIKAAGSHAEGYFTDGGTIADVTFPYEGILYLKLVSK